VVALKNLLAHTTLELYPSITEHVFDVATILSDHISDDVRNHAARFETTRATDCPLSLFILGDAAPVDGWLVLTKPVNLPLNQQTSSQPSTPTATQNQASPYQSPQLAASNPATPQQRYFNQQQQQQRQQLQQAQQAQQMRTYPQYSQHSMQPNRQLPGALQRTPSYQGSASPLQQMQQMQQMHGLAQQRATQPSPVHSQRPTPAASQGGAGNSAGGNAALSKLQTSYNPQQRESKQYPFMQPRWEILAESSGNPNLNETAINLSLFGARKV
jgi:mediator of RNA polymerase II transcription subunit 12